MKFYSVDEVIINNMNPKAIVKIMAGCLMTLVDLEE